MSRVALQALERLADVSLSTDEKQQLAHKLTEAMWGKRLDALLRRVDQRQRGLPPLSLKEIVQEVKAVRRSRASRRRP